MRGHVLLLEKRRPQSEPLEQRLHAWRERLAHAHAGGTEGIDDDARQARIERERDGTAGRAGADDRNVEVVRVHGTNSKRVR